MSHRFDSVLALLLLLVAVLGCANTSSDSENSATISLNAKAVLTSTGLEVTNNDSFVYSHPNFMIHTGSLFTSYTANSADIAPHKTIKIPYSSFTDTDGTRFNYFTTKPSMVTMECKVNNQKAFAGWQF